MQFYLNGYKPGDPFVEDPHPSVAERPEGLPEEADVLIVGCGPAGLVLAAQLANFPGHQDRGHRPQGRPARGGPGRRRRLPHRGDVRGVRPGRPAGRTRATGSTRSPSGGRTRDDRTKITRTGRIQDVEEGLSEMPHVIVNQARMLAYLLDHMERSASKLRAVLRPARHRHPDRHQRLVGVPGDGHRAAPEGPRGDRGDLDDPGQVRRRLRRLAQRRPDRDRPRAGRRPDEPVLGRHGRPGGHRLPGHPAQVRDPLRQRRATS